MLAYRSLYITWQQRIAPIKFKFLIWDRHFQYDITEVKQEGWLSPTERYASVSAISQRHNLATSGESRRYVVAFTHFAGGGICWLPQESLRHILASPGYAPGTIAVNVTWMETGFNACEMHSSMYPSSTVSQ